MRPLAIALLMTFSTSISRVRLHPLDPQDADTLRTHPGEVHREARSGHPTLEQDGSESLIRPPNMDDELRDSENHRPQARPRPGLFSHVTRILREKSGPIIDLTIDNRSSSIDAGGRCRWVWKEIA